MYLFAPDVLAEARGLSPVLSGIGVALGGMLWLCGWRWHRFWVVVGITLIGGVIGLQTGRSSGGHILAMGLLLALSAGLLALELARVFSFIAAGTAVWVAASGIFPKGQELWVAFLIGGLLGVLLYRFWTMLLTSFLGVILGAHAILCVIENLFLVDVENLAKDNSAILNGAGLVATLLGVLGQSLLERWHLRRKKRRKIEKEAKIREDEREHVLAEMPHEPKRIPWIWQRIWSGKKHAA